MPRGARGRIGLGLVWWEHMHAHGYGMKAYVFPRAPRVMAGSITTFGTCRACIRAIGLQRRNIFWLPGVQCPNRSRVK